MSTLFQRLSVGEKLADSTRYENPAQNAYVPSGPQTTVPAAEIPGNLDALEITISEVQGELGMLIDKLRPLIPPPPPSGNIEKAIRDEPVMSAIGDRIRQQTYRLHDVTNTLRDLRNVVAL